MGPGDVRGPQVRGSVGVPPGALRDPGRDPRSDVPDDVLVTQNPRTPTLDPLSPPQRLPHRFSPTRTEIRPCRRSKTRPRLLPAAHRLPSERGAPPPPIGRIPPTPPVVKNYSPQKRREWSRGSQALPCVVGGSAASAIPRCLSLARSVHSGALQRSARLVRP